MSYRWRHKIDQFENQTKNVFVKSLKIEMIWMTNSDFGWHPIRPMISLFLFSRIRSKWQMNLLVVLEPIFWDHIHLILLPIQNSLPIVPRKNHGENFCSLFASSTVSFRSSFRKKGSDRLANECAYLKLVKGKKKVWSTRMEYQIRIQRIRFAYFNETNCHVLGRVWRTSFACSYIPYW